MIGSIVLDLSHSAGNPRNSEGAFATLSNGQLIYAYSRYNGDSWSDHASADIAARYSDDGGKTWRLVSTAIEISRAFSSSSRGSRSAGFCSRGSPPLKVTPPPVSS